MGLVESLIQPQADAWGLRNASRYFVGLLNIPSRLLNDEAFLLVSA